jgi:sortase B
MENEKNIDKKKKRGRILYWSTVSVLVVIIVVCGALIGHKLITDSMDKGEYDELAQMKDSIAATATRPTIPPTTEPADTQPEEEPQATEPTQPPVLNDSIILEYQAMYALNSDMVGWIQIPDSQINYPVVHTPDKPNFYLRRNFYKENATCGTIFVREACDVNLPSDNVTVYGHNMRNGTMFADLLKYKSKSYWEEGEHRYIYFDTLTEYHTYEIFSVFLTSADLTKGFTYHIYDTFPTEADFNKYVSTCKNMDLYETGVQPAYGEKLLTLSTCDKSITDGRLVVVARRVL